MEEPSTPGPLNGTPCHSYPDRSVLSQSSSVFLEDRRDTHENSDKTLMSLWCALCFSCTWNVTESIVPPLRPFQEFPPWPERRPSDRCRPRTILASAAQRADGFGASPGPPTQESAGTRIKKALKFEVQGPLEGGALERPMPSMSSWPFEPLVCFWVWGSHQGLSPLGS